MIDSSTDITAGFLRRWMTVKKLKSLLAQLDDDMTVEPNQVGNLAIISPDGEYVGYVDFNEESVQINR